MLVLGPLLVLACAVAMIVLFSTPVHTDPPPLLSANLGGRMRALGSAMVSPVHRRG